MVDTKSKTKKKNAGKKPKGRKSKKSKKPKEEDPDEKAKEEAKKVRQELVKSAKKAQRPFLPNILTIRAHARLSATSTAGSGRQTTRSNPWAICP